LEHTGISENNETRIGEITVMGSPTSLLEVEVHDNRGVVDQSVREEAGSTLLNPGAVQSHLCAHVLYVILQFRVAR